MPGENRRISEPRSWFLAQTKALQEERGYHHLLNQGFAAYLPRHQVEVRGKLVSVPVFRRYIFIRPEGRARLGNVKSTRGCQDIVYFGEAAARVPDRIVDELKSREEGGFVNLPPPLQAGDPVRVIKGPLDQLQGVYEGDDTKGQANFLVELFGRAMTVKINKEWLRSSLR